MSETDNDIKTARLEQLSMSELKAIHLVIFGEHVHRAQRRALVSRIRQAMGACVPERFQEAAPVAQEASVATTTVDPERRAQPRGARSNTADGSGDDPPNDAAEDETGLPGQSGVVPVSIPLLRKPLKDLGIAELQLRCLLMSGRPTRSRSRTYLVRAIRKMERHGPITPRPVTKTGPGDPESRNLSVRLPVQALVQIDALSLRLGIGSRSAFTRQSIYRYLCELGETNTASLLATLL